MRWNILTYQAPRNYEGYDLICTHPDLKRDKASEGFTNLLRVQVKSRYPTDHGWVFPVKKEKLDDFDFLIAVFLNIGNFLTGDKEGLTGYKQTEFYTFTRDFITEHHNNSSSGHKLPLREMVDEFKNLEMKKVLNS